MRTCEQCQATEGRDVCFTRCEVCASVVCRKCKPWWSATVCSRCQSVAGDRPKELKKMEAKRKRIMKEWAKESVAKELPNV